MKQFFTLAIFFCTLSSLNSQASKVRWVVCIQESVINEYGIDEAITGFEHNYEFFEKSITNGIEYWDIEIDTYLNPNTDFPQSVKIVNIITLPDSIFNQESNMTSTWLSRFSHPNDGWYDEFSPDSLGIKNNQARVLYIIDNESTNTSGTASTLAAVVRWSAIGNSNGNYNNIAAHELSHNYFAQHATAVQLETYVIISGDTIAKPTDWTLDHGVGPYQAILSSGAIDVILTADGGKGLISAAENFPELELQLINQSTDSIMQHGDTINLVTQIHDSWVRTKPTILAKNEEGDILIDSIHFENEMSHEVIVPSNLSGNYPLKLIIINEPTNESDTIQLNFTIDNNTSTIENDNSINRTVNIFPNPAFRQITVDLTNLKGNAEKFSLYDSSGTIFLRQNIIKKVKVNLNIENLVNGIYFVEIELDNGNKITRKIIVNN